MLNSSKANSDKPCTPVRKRILDFFKPTIALGKRGREIESGKFEGSADTAQDVQQSSPVALKRSASVALLNEDQEIEETVVITALETIPFCCHEDLLTMTRPQLFAVVEALNAKLPSALRIDIKPSSTDNVIRSAIELIVGIKRTVPAAPKAAKLGLSPVADSDDSVSPPTSPLAMKNYHRGAHQANPHLAVLQEEDEGAVIVTAVKPMKRIFVQDEGPTRKRRRMSAQAAIPARRRKSSRDLPNIPALETGVKRAMSQRVPVSCISPPRSSRVLRSQSQKLPSAAIKINTTFITVQRPRYHFRSTSKGTTKMSTQTCELDRFREGSLPTQRNRERPRSPEEMDQEIISTSTSSSDNIDGKSSRSPSAGADSGYAAQRWMDARSKGERKTAMDNKADIDDGAEVTFGLQEMTMAASGPDAVTKV